MLYALVAVKSVAAWFVLMFVGKLLFEVVAGALTHPIMMTPTPEGVGPFVASLYTKGRRATAVATVVFAVLALGYLALLFRFLNLGVVLAAVLLMAARIPDFLVEIQTGQKMRATGAAGHVAAIASWLALPVLWVSFS